MSEEDDRADELYERLKRLAKDLPDWLCINRDKLLDQVIATVLGNFAAAPSPEQCQGIENGLDFLGLVKSEGSNNGLYQVTMDQLDDEIYSAVANLDADEQVVLLLPLMNGDTNDLATDWDTQEWGTVLRRCSDIWGNMLHDIVFDQVKWKDRYQAGDADDTDDDKT